MLSPPSLSALLSAGRSLNAPAKKSPAPPTAAQPVTPFRRPAPAIATLLLLSLTVACGSDQNAGAVRPPSETGSSMDEPLPNFTTTLKMAHYFSVGDPREKLIREFMERVTERTDGKVKFEYFPAGQLIQGPEAYDALNTGVADIAVWIPSYWSDRTPFLAEIQLLPAGYNTVDAYDIVLNGGYEILQGPFEREGRVHPVMYFATPALPFFTKSPLNFPEELEGMRIRQPSPAAKSIVEALGGTVINIPLTDTAEAGQAGTVDGAVTSYPTARQYGIDAVFPYATVTPVISLITPVAVSLEKWESLPPAVQDVFTDTGRELMAEDDRVIERTEQDEIAGFVDSGGRLVEWPDEDNERFQAEVVAPIVAGVESRWRDEYPEVEQFFDLVRRYGGLWK